MGLLDTAAVKRVRSALAAAGAVDKVVELAATARSAEDAAAAIGTELGSIVKSLVFVIGGKPVMALVSGDRRCVVKALPGLLGIDGKVKRANADEVRQATGYSIGGVPPLGLASDLPMVIDAGLDRFPTVYAAAGHPHCIFPTTFSELTRLTGGTVSTSIGEPI